MDYFQGVVGEYLRANRATFVNPEFCLMLDAGVKSPPKGRSWYVDLLAVCFPDTTAYLCEVTYDKAAGAMIKRLTAWSLHWPTLVNAVRRDGGVPDSWNVRPWLFVPEVGIANLVSKLPALPITPRITPLEMTQPWNYCGWDRHGEADKPAVIPVEMRT